MPNRRPLSSRLGLGAAAALVAGCGGPFQPAAPTARPAFALSVAAGTAALARPTARQWSTGLVNGEAIQRLAAARPAFPERRVQAVTATWSGASAAFGATGRISSAPSYHYYTKICYWLTDTGWLLRLDTRTNAASAVKIAGTDTFPDTAITLSTYGQRAYVVSAQGNFHAIDTATGAHVQAPVSMGGTSVHVPFGTAPFLDPLASRPDGAEETLYAVTASGVLNRFICSATGVTLAQSYTLPVSNTASHLELCRSAPIVLGGRAVVATWRRATATPYNHADDEGALLYYDTGARSTSPAVTAGASVRRTVVGAPIWATPALDVDDSLVPTLAFFPAGAGVTMVNMATGDAAQSVPLAIDGTAMARGTLAAYAYGTTGTSSVTKAPVAGGSAVLYQNNAVDTANVTAAKQVSGTNANQAYGYMKFRLDEADVSAGNVLKVVTDARLALRCNRSSNHLGMYAPAAPRVFRVHPQLAAGTGAAWTSGNLSYAARPPHMDGTALSPTTGTLGAQASWELGRTGSSVFLNGTDYAWQGKGQVGQPHQDYAFGMVHTQLFDAPSLLGGLASVPAPRFVGGAGATGPRLVLTLSRAGFASPTARTAVSLDSINRQVFVTNSNALFKVSYATALNTWADRAASFSDDHRTTFALTRLGLDSDAPGLAGPTSASGGRFVENVCAPMFDGTYVYVQDNHPGYLRSGITRFLPGASGVAPTVSASTLLPDTGGDGRAAPPFMTYDYESNRLMAATYNPGAASGRAWVLNRF